jgi:hypothetical protein
MVARSFLATVVKEEFMAQKKKVMKKHSQKSGVQQMVADVESLANQLRKRVAQVATQVEKYLNQVRKDLGWKPAKPTARKPTAKKRTSKARASA